MSTRHAVSRPGHRSGARARWLLPILAVGVLLSCRGEEGVPPEEAAEREAAAAEAAIDWPCEAKGYPCTWEEVSAEATERTFALADQALDRFEPGKAAEFVEWLEAQPGVVEVHEEEPTVVWFRLEGGRPIYVDVHAPDAPIPSGSALGETSLRPEPRIALASINHLLTLPRKAFVALGALGSATPLPGVTGRDRNRDRRVNQRDRRKALILEPVDWEFCYEKMSDYQIGWIKEVKQAGATGRKLGRYLRDRQRAVVDYCSGEREVEHLVAVDMEQGVEVDPADIRFPSEGELIEGVLDEIPAYTGNVTRLVNEEVDLSAFTGWMDYDVVHVASHGTPNSVTIGANIGWSGKGRLSGAAAKRRGLSPWVTHLKGVPGTRRRVWSANSRFFRITYPGGLDRTFVFFNSCSGTGHPGYGASPLAASLLGKQTMVFGWGSEVEGDQAVDKAFDLYIHLTEGWSGQVAMERVAEDGHHVFAREPGRQSTAEELTREGAYLGWRGSDMRIREIVRLLHPQGLAGRAGDVVRDGDDLADLVIGHLDDDVDDVLRVTVEVEAIEEDARGITFVQLELDGKTVGGSEDLSKARRVDEKWHLDFEKVAVGRDLKPEEEYELEAVVRLPEGGESRYAALLSSRACYWELDIEGTPRAGHYSGKSATFIPAGDELLIMLSGTDPYLMINLGVRGEISPTGERHFRMGGIYSPAARSRGWVDPPDDGNVNITFQAEPLMSHLVYTTGDGTPIYDIVGGKSQVIGHYPSFSDLFLRGDPASSVRGHMAGTMAVSPDIYSEPTEKARVELRFRAENVMQPGGTMPRLRVCQ